MGAPQGRSFELDQAASEGNPAMRLGRVHPFFLWAGITSAGLCLARGIEKWRPACG